MTDKLVCPQCETGHLVASAWEDDFRHGDSTIHVADLECYVCDLCGADPVFTDQIRRNQVKIADAKRRADRMLTSEDIRSLRGRLNLTQQEAAALFGGGANSFSKYERGDVIQSDPMDRLLKLVGSYPFLLDALRALVGVGEISCDISTSGYESSRPVSMNDEAYSSRVVAGRVVLVATRNYDNILRAA